ncbi:MAG: DUF4145 domain-containing protein [Clostridiales bacterium]|nr:DUF4145 domain-containing protein [Clostridiales bacterium]
MNFDFLKELRGLGHVYENCNNAEKLAMTMPVQSVFTSRKSAELLAKFIYMAAHNQEMEELTFADILSDMTVRKFINSRDVMDAFHYIRKNGNRAVHSDDENTAEDAVAVLQDLHYIAGETASMLGLIHNYPSFDDRIASFPEAKFVDEEDIDKKARAMVLAYIAEFNAQEERDKYIETKDYDWVTYSIEGNVEMHEYLEFKYKPKQVEIIEYLQTYLATLIRFSIERSPENAEELELSYPVTLDAKLIIGGTIYSSENMESFILAIVDELPKANGFIIDCTCTGNLREYFNDEPNENGDERLNMIRKDAVWTGAGMLDTLEQFKRRNVFEYKLAIFYPDSGESKYKKIHNGKEIDVISSCTEEIVDHVFDEEWWSWSLNLCAEFDINKHHDELMKLQSIVRDNIPESQVSFCEDAWEDGDFHIFCNGIQWNCKCLREIQNFLDKINEVFLPIKDDVDAVCDGTWEIKNRFAVATWEWTKQGFKVKGTCF